VEIRAGSLGVGCCGVYTTPLMVTWTAGGGSEVIGDGVVVHPSYPLTLYTSLSPPTIS